MKSDTCCLGLCLSTCVVLLFASCPSSSSLPPLGSSVCFVWSVSSYIEIVVPMMVYLEMQASAFVMPPSGLNSLRNSSTNFFLMFP